MNGTIFNKPINDISFNDVQEIIKEGMREFLRMEYKSAYSSRDVSKQIAKELSAFANTQGGILLIGVEEEGRIPTGICGIPKQDDIDEEQRIKQIAFRSIYPPLIGIEVRAYDIPTQKDRQIIMVRVAESDQVPHFVEKRTEFYLRVDDCAEPIRGTDEDYEWLRQRRNKSIEQRNSLICRARERASNALAKADGNDVIFELIISPAFPTVPIKANIGELISIASEAGRGIYHEILGSDYTVAYQSLAWHEASGNRYTEYNMHGMLYAQRKIVCYVHENKNAGTSILGLKEDELLQYIVLLFNYSKYVIEAMNYNGLIYLSFELKNIRSKYLRAVRDMRTQYPIGSELAEMDDSISLYKNVTIEQLRDESDSIMGELLMAWAMCFGRRVMVSNLEQAKEIIKGYKRIMGL